MRESVSQPFLYSLIAIFIITIFAILIGTMSYFKAYKINSKIVSIIEKYEGYNDIASSEIVATLRTIGYNLSVPIDCKEGNISTSHLYCVYQSCDGSPYPKCHYKVTTYLTIEFPVLSSIVKVPIHAETNSIYQMG